MKYLNEFDKNKLNGLHGFTPVFSVALVNKAGAKEHFANFYGTEINNLIFRAKAEQKIQEKDDEIFKIIGELEQKIKAGDFKEVENELSLEIELVELGNKTKYNDPLYCTSLENAFDLFKKAYAKIMGTELKDSEETLATNDDINEL